MGQQVLEPFNAYGGWMAVDIFWLNRDAMAVLMSRRTLRGPEDQFGRVLNKVKGPKMIAEILGVTPPPLGAQQGGCESGWVVVLS